MKLAFMSIFVIFLAFDVASAQDESEMPLRSWENEEMRLKDRSNLKKLNHEIELYLRRKKSPVQNMSLSIFFPGSGQFMCGNKLKGALFFTSTLAAGGGSIYFLNLSNENYGKYKIADNIDDINRYWDDSEKYLLYAEIAGGLASAIWLLNIVDAYFTTQKYNHSQFNRFYYGHKKNGLSPYLGLSKEKVEIKLVYSF